MCNTPDDFILAEGTSLLLLPSALKTHVFMFPFFCCLSHTFKPKHTKAQRTGLISLNRLKPPPLPDLISSHTQHAATVTCVHLFIRYIS